MSRLLMSPLADMRSVWLDGRPADAEDLRALALVNYGHFTSMQVRGLRVQGFDLHLQRLRDATREMFGSRLDDARVRMAIRDGLSGAGVADASVRITAFARGLDLDTCAENFAPELLVSIAPPAAPPQGALRVKSCVCVRDLPHIKHVGTFPLFLQRRLARQTGFDDALLIDGDGRVCEGSVWNIGFRDGRDVVWPQAAALRGTGERLLQAGLSATGIGQSSRPVALAEIGRFEAAFAVNSRGVQAIAAIDEVPFAGDDAGLSGLQDALASQPWQAI
jgi:branched-subunit amino acid aminotransferase/4-amino-4-deoxychorismate lyase